MSRLLSTSAVFASASLGLIACSSHTSEMSRVEVGIARAELVDATHLKVGVATCGGSPRARVRESASEVVVSAVSNKPGPGPHPACMDLVSVGLNAPLADRKVIDGSTNREVELENDLPGCGGPSPALGTTPKPCDPQKSPIP